MPVDFSNKTFRVHEYVDGELGASVGGADDAAQAVAIASAIFTVAAAQGRVFVVVDVTGATVAFIGRNPQMTVGFTIVPNPAAVDEVVTVDASTTFGGNPVTYTWDFGDTSPPIDGKTMTHSYTEAGTYTITLTVTDAAGGVGESSQDVTVS